MDLEKKQQELRNAIKDFEKEAGGRMWLKYERARLEFIDALLKKPVPVYWTHNGQIWTNLSLDCFLDSFPSIREWPKNLDNIPYFCRIHPPLESGDYGRKALNEIGVETAYIDISKIYRGFPDRKLLEKVFNVKPLTLNICQPCGAINIRENEFFRKLFEVTNQNNASLFIENTAYTTNPNDPNQILAINIKS